MIIKTHNPTVYMASMTCLHNGDIAEICFCYNKTDGSNPRLEIYKGKNYIVGSARRSWSRSWPEDQVPDNLIEIKDKLKNFLNQNK